MESKVQIYQINWNTLKYYQYDHMININTTSFSDLYHNYFCQHYNGKVVNPRFEKTTRTTSLKQRYTMKISCVNSYINLMKAISFCHHDALRPSHDRASSAWSIYIYWWKPWPIPDMCHKQIWRNQSYPTRIPKTTQLKSLAHWFIEEAE